MVVGRCLTSWSRAARNYQSRQSRERVCIELPRVVGGYLLPSTVELNISESVEETQVRWQKPAGSILFTRHSIKSKDGVYMTFILIPCSSCCCSTYCKFYSDISSCSVKVTKRSQELGQFAFCYFSMLHIISIRLINLLLQKEELP